MLKTKLAQARSFGKKLALATGGALIAGTAAAADHSVAIGAASTDGQTNTTAAVVGLLAIVAVVVGVGFVISVLRKS